MASHSLRFAFVLSCLFFVLNQANADDPYTIKKSSFCFISENDKLCTGDYDFKAVVKEIVVDNDKLSKDVKSTSGSSGVCANALKKAMCAKPSPVCLEGNDASGAERVCSDLRENCPLLEDKSFKKYEEHCVTYMQRKFINLTCVASPEDEEFKGYCPKPSRKMPEFYWKAYKLKSKELEGPMKYVEKVNKITGVDGLVSSECLEKIKKAACIPLYCSEDEKSIMVPNVQDNCNEVMKCINKVFEKYEKLSSMLEPIKKDITGGCDLVVNAIKDAASASTGKSNAFSTLHTQALGTELFLVVITLFLAFFH